MTADKRAAQKEKSGASAAGPADGAGAPASVVAAGAVAGGAAGAAAGAAPPGRQVDVAPLDQLIAIRHEQARLDQFRERADSLRAQVDEPVFRRVVEDYTRRHGTLERRADPLKAQARGEYRTLLDWRAGVESAHEDARLIRQELQFRHAVGELDEAALDVQVQGPEETLAQCRAELASIDALTARFVEAFGSAETLAAEMRAEAETVTDADADADADSEGHAELDARAGAVADSAAEAEADAGAQLGAHAGTHATADIAADVADDAAVDAGADAASLAAVRVAGIDEGSSRTDAGAHDGPDASAQPGAPPVAQPGAQPWAHPGAQAGAVAETIAGWATPAETIAPAHGDASSASGPFDARGQASPGAVGVASDTLIAGPSEPARFATVEDEARGAFPEVMTSTVGVLIELLTAAGMPLASDSTAAAAHVGVRHQLGASTTIGRSEDSQVRVVNPSVSRQHAVITVTPAGYALHDLHSQNGTFINGERVDASLLMDGDEVIFGDAAFLFRLMVSGVSSAGEPLPGPTANASTSSDADAGRAASGSRSSAAWSGPGGVVSPTAPTEI